MMNELKVFEDEEFGKVRVVEMNGEGWLVGKDVAKVLGYSNTRDALKSHTDEEDKADVAIHDGRQNRNMVCINESGMYSLVLSSKLPSAKKFKRWVTSEVLPSIRKNGVYMTDDTIEKALTDPDFLIQLATNLKDEKVKRLEAERKNEINRPKVAFAEAVEVSRNSILIRELAKILKQKGINVGEKKLYQYLRQNGWLIRAAGRDKNQPTQKGMSMGLFEVKECVVNHTTWTETKRTTLVTGKGQLYFVNKLINGIEVQAI